MALESVVREPCSPEIPAMHLISLDVSLDWLLTGQVEEELPEETQELLESGSSGDTSSVGAPSKSA